MLEEFDIEDFVYTNDPDVPQHLHVERGKVIAKNVQIDGFYQIEFGKELGHKSYMVMRHTLQHARQYESEKHQVFKVNDIVKCLAGRHKGECGKVSAIFDDAIEVDYVESLSGTVHVEKRITQQHNLVWSYIDFKPGDQVELLNLNKQEREADNFSKIDDLEMGFPYIIESLTSADSQGVRWIKLKNKLSNHHAFKFKHFEAPFKQNKRTEIDTNLKLDVRQEYEEQGWNWITITKL
jgi:ribosomal protein L24